MAKCQLLPESDLSRNNTLNLNELKYQNTWSVCQLEGDTFCFPGLLCSESQQQTNQHEGHWKPDVYFSVTCTVWNMAKLYITMWQPNIGAGEFYLETAIMSEQL